jgi:transcriptional regulator with XRE-family HTH domain
VVSAASPTVWRRWLAIELRRLRERRGIAQKDAARHCGWSGARLSYLENGQQQPVAEDLDKLLELYDVPPDDRDQYYSAVARSQTEGWWERFEYLVPNWVPVYWGFEQGAEEIRTYEPLLIPGVLQTDDYAKVIMQSGSRRRSNREIARLVELRSTRKNILTRAEAPARLDAVLDESILHRSPAGAPATLGAQLWQLVEMAELPNVTIRVLPLEGGIQSFSIGPFSILSFPSDTPSPVVYIEYRGGALVLESFEEIERYELSFDGLAEMALDPQVSLAMVRELAERHSRH